VKDEIKKNVSILKLLPVVRKAMNEKGWTEDARLSEASGVSTGVVSRFLNRGEISGENLCVILNSLELINNTPTNKKNITNCALPPEAADICDMIKDIYSSSDEQMHEALYTNLIAFKNSAKKDERIENLEKRIERVEKIASLKLNTDTD